MFEFTLKNLQERFKSDFDKMMVLFNEASTAITQLKNLGVDVVDISQGKAIKGTLRGTLIVICEEITNEYKGSSNNALSQDEYFHDCFDRFNETSLEFAKYEELALALEKSAKSLEQEGLEATTKLLINNLLGYNLDALSVVRAGYVSSMDIYQYSSGTVESMREIKEQLVVALGVTGESANLDCFDSYIKELNRHAYNQDLESRAVYGSKLDPIYITHFKTKVTLHFSKGLLESVVAFAAMYQPEMIEKYALPDAA